MPKFRSRLSEKPVEATRKFCSLRLITILNQFAPCKRKKMSTESAHEETPSASSIQPLAPTYIPQAIPHNFPLPNAMHCRGDVAGNWEFFKHQWSDYEIATGLIHRENTIRLATLRSAMGRECLQIFLNLNLSEDDKQNIDRCLEALDQYFKPTRNVVYERYVFNTCMQGNDESTQSYVTRLRKLAASCEYGELTDDLIRDRLVIGLKNNGDKVRLLREKNLDLKKSHPNVHYERSSRAANEENSEHRGQSRGG